MTDGMMTVREVSERLGLSEWSVRRLVDNGQLAHLRVGPGRKLIRVTERQLQDYLRTTTHQGR